MSEAVSVAMPSGDVVSVTMPGGDVVDVTVLSAATGSGVQTVRLDGDRLVFTMSDGREVAADMPPRSFKFEQQRPESVWVIAHPLGGHPSVTVVDTAGTTVFGRVDYVSPSSVRVEFSAPVAGSAFLN